MLTLKKLVPVRLLKNRFFEQVAAAEERGATTDELQALLGKGRAKSGMLEGDLDEGELEIGQVAAMVRDLPTTAALVQRLEREYQAALAALPRILGEERLP